MAYPEGTGKVDNRAWFRSSVGRTVCHHVQVLGSHRSEDASCFRFHKKYYTGSKVPSVHTFHLNSTRIHQTKGSTYLQSTRYGLTARTALIVAGFLYSAHTRAVAALIFWFWIIAGTVSISDSSTASLRTSRPRGPIAPRPV